MTALLIIRLCEQFEIKMDKEQVVVYDSRIIGTTAKLREGDVLTVEQLMYGMMLPSGNDAAYCLANHFGQLIYE